MKASGYDPEMKRWGDIPALYWSRPAEWLYEGGNDRVGQYRNVVIARAQMRKHWPERDEKYLSEKNVKNWNIERLEGGKLSGQKAMWEDCKQKLGGQIFRKRFTDILETERVARKLDDPPSGRPSR